MAAPATIQAIHRARKASAARQEYNFGSSIHTRRKRVRDDIDNGADAVCRVHEERPTLERYDETRSERRELSLEEAVKSLDGERGLEAVAALEKMASGEGEGRQGIVDGGAVEAICSALRPAAVGVWIKPSRPSDVVQLSSGDQHIEDESEDHPEDDQENSIASLKFLGTDRALWDVCISLLSRLCLFESEACRRIVECQGLDLLAMAARPGEPKSIRLKALAALAAVGVWSGPHYAVEIVSIPSLVETMCGALSRTQSLPQHLQGAIYDALVAMAHRHRAREIMKSKGCDRTFRSIAVRASETGDYATAGRASVAAGHLSGHSIDEYGFLVGYSSSKSTIDLDDAMFGTPVRSQGKSKASISGEEQFSKSPDINKLRYSACAMPPVDLGPAVDANRNVTVARVIDWDANGTDKVPEENTMDGKPAGKDAEARTSEMDIIIETARRPGLSQISVDKGAEDPDVDNDFGPHSRKMSRTLSPLQVFSQSAKNGLERDYSGLKRKSESELSRDHRALAIWTDVLDNHRSQLARIKGVHSRVEAYKKLAAVPIPPTLRSKVWTILLATSDLQRKKKGLYKELLERAEQSLSTDSKHTIDVDVVRTMPSHSLFWAGGAAMGVDSLRSVLRAYAAYSPDVGYCQGMSSIAAMLLMNAKDEEEAFLMLIRFMERFSYKKVFYPGFPQMQQWIKELQPLCERYCPDVMRRLEAENVYPELYMDKWLITALTHNFPHRHVLRIWDVMFLGGSPKIILKACAGILHEGQAKLKSMQFEEMMPFLQKTFADPEQGILCQTNPEPFVELIRSFRFKGVAEVQPSSDVPQEQSRPRRRKRDRFRACFPGCFRDDEKAM